ncbi:sensor histidine kinase [Amnibacterium sp. CER49]|uniref:sensor histidine kinase n=1 Tax=Amnibacterium sp. CER49 TaxID=3039161 RepID=UPI002448749C|nr:sensor histidine kinase [Amnibacterium sp. CER49]MDH2443706.1 sensor histidine kinase [Amnibacterium sp. CER49]
MDACAHRAATPPSPDPALPRRRFTWPLAPALLLQAGAAGWTASHGAPGRAVAYLACALLGTAALLVLGRRAPGPAVVVAGTTSIAGLLLVPVPPFALLPFLVGVVAAAAQGARWWALAAAGGALLLPVLQLVLTTDPLAAVRALGEVLLLVVAVGIGEGVRARVARGRERAAAESARRRIVAEQERVRIARELHDVLAHSLSSITVQAGVGLHLARARPEAAVEALEAIRGASREALDEVRAALAVLRGDEDAPRRPEPGLAALPALVTESVAAGERVTLDDRLEPRPPQPVQLALFRIVQESVTNARRHAPGTAVAVELCREGDAAVARIRTSGGVRPAPIAEGNGITGMRERAALLGGTLDLDPAPDGLLVEARLPLPEAS